MKRLGGEKMRAEFINKQDVEFLLAVLPRHISLICRVMMTTGLRVSDAVALETRKLSHQQMYIRERKTGKGRRIYIRKRLLSELRAIAGDKWVFEGRNSDRHITRQAVYMEIKRACDCYMIPGNISPHSFRKVYAVKLYKRFGLERARAILKHDNLSTTLLYCLSDKLK